MTQNWLGSAIGSAVIVVAFLVWGAVCGWALITACWHALTEKKRKHDG